jgi:hypothetical protein
VVGQRLGGGEQLVEHAALVVREQRRQREGARHAHHGDGVVVRRLADHQHAAAADGAAVGHHCIGAQNYLRVVRGDAREDKDKEGSADMGAEKAYQ